MGNQNVVFAFHQICKPASKLPAGCVQTSPDKFDICHVRASERAAPLSSPPPHRFSFSLAARARKSLLLEESRPADFYPLVSETEE